MLRLARGLVLRAGLLALVELVGHHLDAVDQLVRSQVAWVLTTELGVVAFTALLVVVTRRADADQLGRDVVARADLQSVDHTTLQLTERPPDVTIHRRELDELAPVADERPCVLGEVVQRIGLQVVDVDPTRVILGEDVQRQLVEVAVVHDVGGGDRVRDEELRSALAQRQRGHPLQAASGLVLEQVLTGVARLGLRGGRFEAEASSVLVFAAGSPLARLALTLNEAHGVHRTRVVAGLGIADVRQLGLAVFTSDDDQPTGRIHRATLELDLLGGRDHHDRLIAVAVSPHVGLAVAKRREALSQQVGKRVASLPTEGSVEGVLVLELAVGGLTGPVPLTDATQGLLLAGAVEYATPAGGLPLPLVEVGHHLLVQGDALLVTRGSLDGVDRAVQRADSRLPALRAEVTLDDARVHVGGVHHVAAFSAGLSGTLQEVTHCRRRLIQVGDDEGHGAGVVPRLVLVVVPVDLGEADDAGHRGDQQQDGDDDVARLLPVLVKHDDDDAADETDDEPQEQPASTRPDVREHELLKRLIELHPSEEEVADRPRQPTESRHPPPPDGEGAKLTLPGIHQLPFM